MSVVCSSSDFAAHLLRVDQSAVEWTYAVGLGLHLVSQMLTLINFQTLLGKIELDALNHNIRLFLVISYLVA